MQTDVQKGKSYEIFSEIPFTTILGDLQSTDSVFIVFFISQHVEMNKKLIYYETLDFILEWVFLLPHNFKLKSVNCS